MKNWPHPENSGRQPRARSDGKTIGVQTPIGRLEMINETKMLLIFVPFSTWTWKWNHASGEAKNCSQKSAMVVFTGATYNKYTLCRSLTRFGANAFYCSAFLDWDSLNLNQGTFYVNSAKKTLIHYTEIVQGLKILTHWKDHNHPTICNL